MKSKSASRLMVHWLPYGVVAAFVAAAGIWLWNGLAGKSVVAAPVKTARPSPSAEVALANRTLCVTGFPVRFSEHQTVSARGTAPYVVALADGSSKPEALVAVRNCGARVIGPLPPNALLVETSAAALGRISVDPHFAAASEWLPEDKVDARLKPLLEAGGETLDVTVVALASADIVLLAEVAAQKGGTRVEGCLNGKSSITLTLPRAVVAELAKRGDVRWLEPFVRPKLLNDQAVGSTAMNVKTVWNAHGLTGEGQLVTTSDTGIDTGDLTTMHADLRNRLAGFKVVSGCYSYDANGHGTHTAGSIVGDGSCSGGQIRGTAYGAKLWAWFCGGAGRGIYTPEACSDLFRPTGATNACIHSASWGCDVAGAYDQMSRAIDEYVWEHPDFLPVIANGNAGKSGAQTVGSPATAKNVLSVGSAQSPRSGDPTVIAATSSRGPCADGRIKPDVCSPGVSIVSTRAYGANLTVYSANRNYACMSGTSMATPLTAGSAALVRQWLAERRGFTNAVPTAALVKAVLTGGAKDVATPNNTFGWGRVDLGESLYPSKLAVGLVDRVPYFDGIDCTVREVTLTRKAAFDVQLAWVDYPATAGASKTLVNDLDLVVSNKTTGAVWRGNGISGGDHTNNVESVRIASATPGDYAVIVRGYDVCYESPQGGAAAVYMRGAFAGGEEPEKELAIVAHEPATANVAMAVGETNVFQVTVAASDGVTPTYVWMVDGVAVAGATTNRFAYGTSWADHGQHLIRVVVSAPGGLMDSRRWTTTVNGEVHVDAATGDDATATGTAERPYASIGAALAKSIAGDCLRVGAGTYVGGLVMPAGAVRIESTEGPEATAIDGGGTGRCFDASACPKAVLSGFTLTNGLSASGYGGGALGGTLTNCVIRNCSAMFGGGACGATLIDSVIADCTAEAPGGGACDSYLENCTVRRNRTTVYYRYSSSSTAGGGVDYQCEALNTILWDNIGPDGLADDFESFLSREWFSVKINEPTLDWCCAPSVSAYGSNSLTNDPLFASSDAADPRLYEISPCLGAGYGRVNIGAYRGTGVVKALPAIDVKTATGEEVSNAVASVGYVDPAVQKGIGTNGATYAAFAAWSTNGLKSTAVVHSTRAYDSFLVREIVAAPTLLGEGNETSVELSALEPASDGTCSTTVRLMDGETAVPLCSVKAAFAKHTQVGDDVTGLAPADPANVEAASVDGGRAVKLTIRPPASTLRYFMRFVIR